MADEIARGLLQLQVEIDQRQVEQASARAAALVQRAFEAGASETAKGIETAVAGGATGAAQSFEKIMGGVAARIPRTFESALQKVQPVVNKILGAVSKAGSEVFKTLTGAVQAAGIAFGVLAGRAIQTGIEFNKLQQTVRGALKAILGTEEASNKLLAAVNKLNDSSPFARQVFLQLTQTLAGFGVEAAKIPAVLDGIQQAVAATGGGEDDLLAIGQAMARIASEGRITGDVIQLFASRGINVAELLGDSFDDLRENGTKAIDALSEALSVRFAGATDSVFNNFEGASSRFQSRLRDIGAGLTKAFISPFQGGAAVTALNNISVALTKVRDIVVPALQPAMQSLANTLIQVSEGFSRIGESINIVSITQAFDAFKGLIPVLAAVVGFLPNLLQNLPIIGNLFARLGGPVLAVALALATIPEVREAFASFITTLTPLATTLLPAIAQLFEQLATAIGPGVVSIIEILGGALLVLGQALTLVVLGITQLLEFLGPLSPLLAGLVVGVVALAAAVKLAAIANTLLAVATGQAAAATAAQKIVFAVSTAALVAYTLVSQGAAAASIVLAEAVGVTTAAFLTNPFVLAAAALVALGVAIFAAYKRFRVFRDIVDKVIDVVGNGLRAAFEFLSPVIEFVTDHFKTFLAVALIPIGLIIINLIATFKALQVVFNLLVGAVKLVVTFFQNLIIIATPMAKLIGNIVVKIVKFIAELPGIKLMGKAFTVVKDIVEDIVDVLDRAGKAVGGLTGLLSNLPGLGFLKKDVDDLSKSADNLDKIGGAGISNFGTKVSRAVGIASTSLAGLQKHLSSVTDQLQQSLSDTSKINALFSTARAVESAQASLAGARERVAETTRSLNALEAERARIAADTAADVRELAAAEAGLTQIRNSLRDLNQEQVEIERELAQLRGTETVDDLAAADRAILRAKIALNEALRAEKELQEEVNQEQSTAIDLSGLTIEEIRTRLSNVRATLEAQKALTKETAKDGKTQEEIDDEKLGKKLDVADAEQALKDSITARQELERSVGIEIRENEERLEEIQIKRGELLTQQEEQLNSVNRIRAGETTRAREILELDKQITAAKREQRTASEAVATASKQVALAEAEAAKAAADYRDDKVASAEAELNIFNLKRDGLIFDEKTDTFLKSQLDSIRKQIDDVTAAQQAVANFKPPDVVQKVTVEQTGLQNLTQSGLLGGSGVLGPALTPVFDSSGGGDFGDQIIELIARALVQKGFFLTTARASALAEGGLITSPTNAIMGEGYKHELVLPLTNPDRVWALLSQHLPRYPGALGAVQSLVGPSPVSLPKISTGGVGTYKAPFGSGPLTERQGDEIIRLLKENGKAQITVEAPISVSVPIEDPDLIARRVARKIEDSLMNGLGR